MLLVSIITHAFYSTLYPDLFSTQYRRYEQTQKDSNGTGGEGCDGGWLAAAGYAQPGQKQ